MVVCVGFIRWFGMLGVKRLFSVVYLFYMVLDFSPVRWLNSRPAQHKNKNKFVQQLITFVEYLFNKCYFVGLYPFVSSATKKYKCIM